MFALTWLSSIYYDNNGYGYDGKDGNDRKYDNPEIKQKTKNMHLSPCIRTFSNSLTLFFTLFYCAKDYDMYDSNLLWLKF